MSQFPPESPYDPPLEPFGPEGGAPTQGNGMAVTSLVFGLVGFCVPFLGGLLAIIFGIIGVTKAKNPRVGGKGMAIAGLVLGALTIVGYGVGTFAFVSLIKNVMTSVGETPNEFFTAISKGDVNAAIAKVDPAQVERASIESAVDAAKPWGPFQKFTSTNMEQSNVNGVTTITLKGPAVFQNQTKEAEMSLANSAAAPLTWKITRWSFK